MRKQNHNAVLFYERSLRNTEGNNNNRHNRYLDSGNGSNKSGNHCSKSMGCPLTLLGPMETRISFEGVLYQLPFS